MTGARARLDVADLVVIAARVIGIDTDAVLAQMDIAAARDALTEVALALAGPPILPNGGLAPIEHAKPRFGRSRGRPLDRAGAAAAGVIVVHALLRRRPFPRHCEQVAVAAGLQFLSLNGWHADLNPPAAAAVVIEALASGQLAPEAAATWLSSRLIPVRGELPRQARVVWRRAAGASRGVRPASRRLAGASRGPRPPARRPTPAPATKVARPAGETPLRRALATALLALAVGSVSLLAAACSRGGDAPATPAIHTPVSTAPAHAGHP